ncbi:hypothetical protein [Chitinophaga filiformis]|uniref:Uncharacterized protein n=1 Tax=Chitinophaga filiformis TaxID=104663 RepID=A0A1G7SYT1_CHIFI|nr:hypothetical protein [Chitinophaga filiformis]SDG28246.1 hypothetical protein SAMN04488121_1031075 [Chitinophaga filiformis]
MGLLDTLNTVAISYRDKGNYTGDFAFENGFYHEQKHFFRIIFVAAFGRVQFAQEKLIAAIKWGSNSDSYRRVFRKM